MGKYDLPERSDFSSQAVYERVRKKKIMEIRRRKRRLRKIVKGIIIGIMILLALLICIALGLGVRAIVRRVTTKTVAVEVLGERNESLSDSETELTAESEEPAESIGLYVCIDPGHGGIDGGASNEDETRLEKDDVLALGLLVRDELEDLGVEVIMTREDTDTFPSLSERTTIANEAGVDYFVSLHRNSVDSSDTDTKGVEIFLSTKSKTEPDGSYELASNIMEALEEVGISQNRGVRYGSQSSENYDLQVNRDTDMPSCLIELGFLSSDEDNQLYDEHLEEYAKAIAQAIVKTWTNEDGEEETEVNGLLLENTKIQDVDTLDSTQIVYAPGEEISEETNIPTGVSEFQSLYASYQASFIVEDASNEIYLTFDTGYTADYTGEILDILKEENISAVFFVNMEFVKNNESLVQRMIDEGHIIGNHSCYVDSDGIVSQSLEDQRNDIQTLHDYMLEKFSYRMCLFRFPNGIFSIQSLAMVNNLNYQSVFWSYSYNDYEETKQPNEENALETMEEYLHSGAIYLMSTRSSTNANVLTDFITDAKSEGYTFGTYTVQSSDSTESETE